jgi:hypothetical protein
VSAETVQVAEEGPPVAADEAPAAEWEDAPAPDVDEGGFDEGEVADGDGWDDLDGADDVDEAEDLDEPEDFAEPGTQVMEPAPRASAAPAPPAPPTADAGQQTSEYDVLAEEEGRSAEPVSYRPQDHDEAASEGEDVLEETPEFLQETPEHDRLWFEQRPPRDFDFDG